MVKSHLTIAVSPGVYELVCLLAFPSKTQHTLGNSLGRPCNIAIFNIAILQDWFFSGAAVVVVVVVVVVVIVDGCLLL